MNVKQLLESIEETLFEYIMYLVYIPKTLFTVVSRPSWVPVYVNTELVKESKERFDRHVPPIVFWLVLGIMPYYFTMLLYMSISDRYETKLTKAIYDINMFAVILSISLFVIAIPLACAFTIQLFKKGGLNKLDMKRSLYTQFYYFAPVQLFYIPILIFTVSKETSPVWGTLATLGLLLHFWLAYCEIVAIRRTLNIGILKSLLLFPVMYGFCFVFGGLSMLVIFVLDHKEIAQLVTALVDGK